MSCRMFLVSGKVQGVFFREYTRRQAVTLGLTGHAINLDDGKVEVLACGNEQAISRLQDWLWTGSPMASVHHVETLEVAENKGPGPSSFTTA